MTEEQGRPAGVAELRAAWIALGILTVLLHLPVTIGIGIAIAVPWLAAMALLMPAGRGARIVEAWRAAAASRAGVSGLAGLLLGSAAVAVVVSPGAGALLWLWIAAAACAVGAWRGGAALRENLAGWALLGLTSLLALGAAEGVLRIDAVAARIGTPREIDAWRQRYEGLDDRNVLGIRSHYETLRKEAGVLRVVALGDSFTWGDKIASADSTWPALLEDELRERLPATPVEVVNLGEMGFTTVNEAEMLRRLGWQFDPDVVVVQFYMNDILPSGPNFERAYSGWIFPRAWLLPERYRGGPAGRSALLYVAESVLTGWRHGDREEQAEKWLEVYRRRGDEWQDLAGALKEMARSATERGVPIVLVLFPDFIPGLGEREIPALREIHDQVTQVASAAGYSIVDLTPAYIRESPDMRSWWATPYDTHPNAAAAHLAAEQLAGHLLSELRLGGNVDDPNGAPRP